MSKIKYRKCIIGNAIEFNKMAKEIMESDNNIDYLGALKLIDLSLKNELIESNWSVADSLHDVVINGAGIRVFTS